MTIGYIKRKNMPLSVLGNEYIEILKKYGQRIALLCSAAHRYQKTSMSVSDRIEACSEVISIYRTVYRNGDMGYDSYQELCQLHLWIARLLAEIDPDKQESAIREHLAAAIQLVEKTRSLTSHRLAHPLMNGIDALTGAPEELVAVVKNALSEEVFERY